MYQNCCKKCGSIALHIEQKGSQVGLYCDDCGAWQKWCSKDEQRAFEYAMRSATKEENEGVNKYIESISQPTGNTFYDPDKLSDLLGRLGKFVQFLDDAIDKEFEKMPISPEDAIRKSSYCLALKRNKNAIINIINGKEFDYVE